MCADCRFEKLLIYPWQGTYFGGLVHGLCVCVGLCISSLCADLDGLVDLPILQVTVCIYIYGQLQLVLQHPKTGKH